MACKLAGQLAAVLLLALCLGAAPALAAPPLVLEGKACYLLAPQMEILHDPGGGLTLEQVSSPPWSTRFQTAHDAPTLRLGLNQGSVWLRFRLQEAGPATAYYLELDSSHIQYIDAYLAEADPTAGHKPRYRRFFTGSSRPVSSRAVPFRTFVLPLPANPPPQEYSYLRLAASGTMTVRPYIWSEAGLQGRLNGDSYFFGIIYGVLAAMLLTNFFFFITLRDPAYLFYVLYVLCMLLFESSIYGQWDLLLKLSPDLSQKTTWIAGGLVASMAAWFTRLFLRTRALAPVMDNIIILFAGLGLVVAGLGLLGSYGLASRTTHALGLAGPVLALGAGVIVWRKGLLAARYFLMAWSVMAVAVFTMAVKGLGYLPQALSSTLTFPLATAIEVVLLSLALADRVRSLRRQREEAQQNERRFRQMSLTDGLTQLYNKRFLDSRLRSEVDHAARSGQPLSVLMLDVDLLKEFNDRYGHAAGDLVLTTVAQVMRQSLRTSDFPCRSGGDEFVVIMPETNLEQALWAAERIRTDLSGQILQVGPGDEARASLSAGAAQYQGEETPDQLLNRADQAMYQAKQTSQNRARPAKAAS
ncbi:MAG: sensor domain-containing diguanylate cyclase [Proteobacteria bacterium]|nr:sensor domain-containing diguanylate cyclase [Pseudomonadota bacterium]MBU1450045.1 sensor domain-containing diguanylate cyclase [Pseudomonadota bacterium]MBU2467241.1 sensor domain-containing diguanylate cyclase [Pseudomonadota bacterium]MBU2519057.1 sensor domain-containing diguanylate cyclase [Pseudomonadota bacterium]